MKSSNGARPIENVNELQKCLSVVHYPATKEDIFEKVKKIGTDMNVITLVQTLPEREYHTPKEVIHALGLELAYEKIQ